jgi:hypothetical protein
MTYDPDTGDTGTIVDVQSYSYVIVQAIFDLLANDPFFVNFVVRRTASALPVELWSQVPFLGVFINDEPLAFDGAINQGMVKFTHNVPIGFQFILRNNDAEMLLRDLDRVGWYIMRRVLRSDKIMNMLGLMDGGTAVEGVARGRISRPKWGMNGSKNETPVGERQLDLTFFYGTNWEPYGFDDLERITVITGFPIGSTPEEQEQVQQVKMVYEFNPDSVPTPLPPDP